MWEFAYSEHRQPTNYSTRLALAKQARDNVPSQLLLVDALAGGPYNTSFNNPFWCTYGPNPNGMWAIAANGTVTKALSWFNTVDAEAAIRGLAGLPPAPPSPCTTALSQHCNHGVSHASCEECVVKHTRALKKAGCNATDEAAFCDQD